MQALLLWTSRIASSTGVVICVAAIAARLGGIFRMAGVETGTLLQAGMALMLLGCVGFLFLLTLRR